MRRYQLFPFGPGGRLLEAVGVEVETDAAAIGLALDGEFPNGCELWEGYRFLGRFHGAAPQTAVRPARPVFVS